VETPTWLWYLFASTILVMYMVGYLRGYSDGVKAQLLGKVTK